MVRGVHSLMLFIQHFLCRPRRRPPPQGALKDGVGEVGVARDMLEPYEFPFLDSCRKWFLWVLKEADLALPPVVSLELRLPHDDHSLAW